MKWFALVGGLGLVALTAAVGCTIVQSKDEPDGGQAGEGGAGLGGQAGEGGAAGADAAAGSGGASGVGGSGGAVPEEAFPAQAGGLEPAADCVALEQLLKNDAKARNNAQAASLTKAIHCVYGLDGGTGGSAGQGGSGGWAGGPSSSGSIDYSKTNAQAEGVDEADIVKTDGTYLYLLHGEQFVVLTAKPAAQMAVAQSLQLEGQPKEMFVDSGRAVIYSLVDGTKVYAAAGVQPKTPLYPADYGYTNPPPPDPDLFPEGYLLTKATVVELQGTPPVATVTGQLYFEGQYLSARRVENAVRTVITGGAHGPSLTKLLQYNSSDEPEEMLAEIEQNRAANEAKIEASKYQDWLPWRFVREGTAVTASLPGCDEYLVPRAGSSQHGLTQLVSFDWATPKDIRSVNLPVDTRVVYGGTESIYISADGLGDHYSSYVCDASQSPKAGQVAYLDFTYIHEFDYKANAVTPQYMGTGAVPGKILNQFSVDEHAEHFRVATESSLIRYVDVGGGEVDQEWEQSSHVFTMELVDGKELKILGRVDGIGKDEKIYAVRFIDEKAYVITFREMDPLTVVDLSNPAMPKVMGELTIPGFGEYVHPIGIPGAPVTHLLTIGKETESEQSATVIGVALQVFDVSDAMAPKLQQKWVFEGESWGYSEAENNHKAFNYDPYKGVVLFPYVADNGELHSALEVFRIDAQGGADKSITKLGAISHDDFFSGYWWEYCSEVVGTGVRRGVFLGDDIYSVSFGGVKVHALADLQTQLKSLSLQSPSGLGMQCAMP